MQARHAGGALVLQVQHDYLAVSKRTASKNGKMQRNPEMAAFENTRPVVGTLFGGRLGNLFATLVADVAAWNDARVTRNALSRLSDRELDDIGLCRGDIDAIGVRN
jgi:uncharacterized protein YjiS (DUF1127 family)